VIRAIPCSRNNGKRPKIPLHGFLMNPARRRRRRRREVDGPGSLQSGQALPAPRLRTAVRRRHDSLAQGRRDRGRVRRRGYDALGGDEGRLGRLHARPQQLRLTAAGTRRRECLRTRATPIDRFSRFRNEWADSPSAVAGPASSSSIARPRAWLGRRAYSAECVEETFCEFPINGVLGSSFGCALVAHFVTLGRRSSCRVKP
jgi:hypothetical protein